MPLVAPRNAETASPVGTPRCSQPFWCRGLRCCSSMRPPTVVMPPFGTFPSGSPCWGAATCVSTPSTGAVPGTRRTFAAVDAGLSPPPGLRWPPCLSGVLRRPTDLAAPGIRCLRAPWPTSAHAFGRSRLHLLRREPPPAAMPLLPVAYARMRHGSFPMRCLARRPPRLSPRLHHPRAIFMLGAAPPRQGGFGCRRLTPALSRAPPLTLIGGGTRAWWTWPLLMPSGSVPSRTARRRLGPPRGPMGPNWLWLRGRSWELLRPYGQRVNALG